MALEDNERRLQERIRVAQCGWPSDLKFMCDTAELDELDLGRWRLVIIDTLGRWRPLSSTQYNYAADIKVLAEVQRKALGADCAILLIHHTNKTFRATDWQATISGTEGLAGTADTTMVPRRRRNQKTAQLCATGRDIEENEIHLRINEKTRMAEAAVPVDTETNADRLLEALPEDGLEIAAVDLVESSE